MVEAVSRPNIEVRVATDAAAVERVARFRYHVLIETLGGELHQADRARQAVSDPLDPAAVHIFALEGEKMTGSLRICPGGPGKLPEAEHRAFQLERFHDFEATALGLTDRLVIGQGGPSGPVAATLLGAAFKLAQRHGCRFDFAYCPPALVQLYERLGYRRYSDNFVDGDGAYQVPLVLVLEDQAHLNRIKSPFARMVLLPKERSEDAAWFARNFPQAVARPSEQGMNEDGFWQFLTERLHEYPHHGIPLLAGLTHREAKRFLSIGTVLSCRAGDRVVAQGDIGREMFVLLAGEAEARARGTEQPLAEFHRGDVFGEIAYLADTPRSADVLAKTDLEVLVLTQETMRLAMRQVPEIAAKVLFNLSLVLCARLQHSTQALVRQQAAE